MWRLDFLNKTKKLVRLKSPDGEIHFQECKTKFCINAKEYNAPEALKIAKKEANKPLLLNKKIITNPSSLD